MSIVIRQAVTDADYAAAGVLIRQYIESLPFELTFQDFEAELASIATTFGPPRGATFLAERNGVAVGTVSISRYSDDIAEMKRMFVSPAARGEGLGRRLAIQTIETARFLGYRLFRLDTVAALEAANRLYQTLGFRTIDAYRHNPEPDARFFELTVGDVPPPSPIGLVLTGGQSQRMGVPKAAIEIGGSTMTKHVEAALAGAGLEVRIGDRATDAVGIDGPAAGLLAAMRDHPGTDVVMSATDHPYLRTATIEALMTLRGDAVVPLDERPQTMCAVYRPAILPMLERIVATNTAPSLQDAIRQADTSLVAADTWRAWGEDGRSWLSVDTPERLEQVRSAWPEPPASLEP